MTSFAFRTTRLDRCADKRDDPDYIAAALADPRTGVIVFAQGECLIEGREAFRVRFFAMRDLAALGITPWPPVFLGIESGRAVFAVDIDEKQQARIEAAHFVDLWRHASRFAEHEASLLAYAKGMIEWHARHRYCGRSGAANAVEQGGHRLVGAETHTQFPRVDPAIIVLAHRGDECLLGRKAGWPEDWYTTIAGFVEPGESLEDAVCREVKEETNIEVQRVEYVASQPWPFPSSLMVGFHAVAADGEIVCNDKELADAGWFTREDLATHRIRIPPAMSIASHLIELWFDRVGGPSLRELTIGKRWR